MSKYRIASNKSLVKIVRKFWGKVPVSEREMKVFEENLLTGFLRPQLEGKHKIVYTAPLSITLRAYMEKGMTIHKLYNVLAQVVEITKKVDMYGFYLNNLVLDDKLIYVKEITGELYFMYEPLEGRDNSTNVYGFLSDMLAKLKGDDREIMEECKMVRAFLDEPGNYRIDQLEAFIMDVYPQIYQQVTRAEKGLSGFITSSRLSYRQHYGTQSTDKEFVSSSRSLTNREVVGDDEGGTVLLRHDDEDGTVLLQEEGTVLLQQHRMVALLHRKRTGENIEVFGNEFRIGKDAGANFSIRDNKAISRQHATIYNNGAEFMLRDENSTNHTYLNGKMLEQGRMEVLRDGDMIRLADEEFAFSVK